MTTSSPSVETVGMHELWHGGMPFLSVKLTWFLALILVAKINNNVKSVIFFI